MSATASQIFTDAMTRYQASSIRFTGSMLNDDDAKRDVLALQIKRQLTDIGIPHEFAITVADAIVDGAIKNVKATL